MLRVFHMMHREEAELAEAVRLALLAYGFRQSMISRADGDVVKNVWGLRPWVTPGWWMSVHGDKIHLYHDCNDLVARRCPELVERYIPALEAAALTAELWRDTPEPYLMVRRASMMSDSIEDWLKEQGR